MMSQMGFFDLWDRYASLDGKKDHVCDAALHDSQAVDPLLTQSNTGSGVWADAAYRSE